MIATSDKNKLEVLKQNINKSCDSLKQNMLNIVKSLYLIKKQNLYKADGCGTFMAFLRENRYMELLDVSINVVQKQIWGYQYMIGSGVSDKEYNNQYAKSVLLHSANVRDPAKIKKYFKMPYVELMQALYPNRHLKNSKGQFKSPTVTIEPTKPIEIINDDFVRVRKTYLVPKGFYKDFCDNMADLITEYDIKEVG